MTVASEFIPDRSFQVTAIINTSGEAMVVGRNDDSVVIELEGREPLYMDAYEAKVLRAAITAAIKNMEV